MADFEQNLEELDGLKKTLQADLKIMGPHRDVLKLLRSFEQAKVDAGVSQVLDRWDQVEIAVLTRYLNWINAELNRYPTTLGQDRQLLNKLPEKAHPLYAFIIVYRIGQKEILEFQSWLCQQLLN